ncbi:hypothetical protein [Solimonas terrae]|uniref:SH3 domain-containing protein n=1 Tax=Solimonas terrae TaxID=1396819 RepID=A0A6M2BWN1_9GAMM|nr:hypothetical protein [Solimonas terrae]NGY06601.1 hypothetical protein [Solimonas terrae]
MNTTSRPISIAATLLLGATALLLGACGSDAPKPLTARNVSAPLAPPQYLPPGLSTSLKQGDVVDLKAATALMLHPQGKGEVAEKLAPGTLVKLKARTLNSEGPWWLVDTATDAGWIPEAELLRK